MCVCKDHLHGLWSVETLVKCREKRDITILFADSQSFFDYLSTDCPPANLTYISRDGTKTDKTICDYIVKKWKGIKDSIKGLHDDVTVPFLHFEYVEITKKKQRDTKTEGEVTPTGLQPRTT